MMETSILLVGLIINSELKRGQLLGLGLGLGSVRALNSDQSGKWNAPSAFVLELHSSVEFKGGICPKAHSATSRLALTLAWNVSTQVKDQSRSFLQYLPYKEGFERADGLPLKPSISSFPFERRLWFRDKDKINERRARQRGFCVLPLPKRRTRLHLVRTFVCHRSVNTREPLARENTFQPKLRSALIARLQMPQILPGGKKTQKTSHERAILWLPVVRWNRSSPAPGAAYCGETGTGVKWAQTWRKRNTTVPAPEYMFWGWNSKQKWFSRLLFWCRRLRWKKRTKPVLSSYCRGGRKMTMNSGFKSLPFFASEGAIAGKRMG